MSKRKNETSVEERSVAKAPREYGDLGVFDILPDEIMIKIMELVLQNRTQFKTRKVCRKFNHLFMEVYEKKVSIRPPIRDEPVWNYRVANIQSLHAKAIPFNGTLVAFVTPSLIAINDDRKISNFRVFNGAAVFQTPRGIVMKSETMRVEFAPGEKTPQFVVTQNNDVVRFRMGDKTILVRTEVSSSSYVVRVQELNEDFEIETLLTSLSEETPLIAMWKTKIFLSLTRGTCIFDTSTRENTFVKNACFCGRLWARFIPMTKHVEILEADPDTFLNSRVIKRYSARTMLQESNTIAFTAHGIAITNGGMAEVFFFKTIGNPYRTFSIN